MNFPKRVMKTNELVALGFTRSELLSYYRQRGQKFARKKNPNLRNSPIEFDTDRFQEFLERRPH